MNAFLNEMDPNAAFSLVMLCTIMAMLFLDVAGSGRSESDGASRVTLLLLAALAGQAWTVASHAAPVSDALTLVLLVAVVALGTRVLGIWSTRECALFAGVALAFPASIYPSFGLASVNHPLWALLLSLLALEFVRAVATRLRRDRWTAHGQTWVILGDGALRAACASGVILAAGGLALGRPLSFLEAVIGALTLSLIAGPVWSRWRKAMVVTGAGTLAYSAAHTELALSGSVVAVGAVGYCLFRLIEALPAPRGDVPPRPFAALVAVSVALTAVGGGSLARISYRLAT